MSREFNSYKNKSFFFFWPILAGTIEDKNLIKTLSLAIEDTYMLHNNECNTFIIILNSQKITSDELILLEKTCNFAVIKSTNDSIVTSFNITEELEESYNTILVGKYSKIPNVYKRKIVEYLYYISSELKLIDDDVYLIMAQILWQDEDLKRRLLDYFNIDELDDDIELASMLDLTKENYND